MPSPNKTPVRKRKASIKKQKCGACGAEGHDRRNCPASPGAALRKAARKQVVEADGVAEAPQEPPLVATVVWDASILDWDKVLYVVFDLETTGRSRQQQEIIELAAQILDPNGIPLEEAIFSELVKPSRPIPPFITDLTTITNDIVSSAQSFPEVAGNFFELMRQHADEYLVGHNNVEVKHIIFVVHNEKVFDIPFLIQQLSVNGMVDNSFLQDRRIGLGIDTTTLAQKSIQTNRTAGIPVEYNLGALYQYVTGQPPTVSHRALADVKATIAVLFHQIFWENRSKFIFTFRRPEEEEADAAVPAAEQLPSLLEDSDTSVSSQDSATTVDNNTGETTEDEDDAGPAGDKWDKDYQFRPSCPLPSQLFEEHFTLSGRSRRQQTGLQCSPFDVNTPIRAWREVFKNVLLDKIVWYTNEYRRVKAKQWQDVKRKDLESFICVLFILAIQKRKDKPSNWFLENELLESTMIKKIMSSRKFFTILRYLHCCSMEPQPVGEDYDPAYKVSEMKDYLEN
jgi:DNA polymerase III epsilon subunit-like protein